MALFPLCAVAPCEAERGNNIIGQYGASMLKNSLYDADQFIEDQTNINRIGNISNTAPDPFFGCFGSLYKSTNYFIFLRLF